MFDADYEDWVREQNEHDSSLGLRGDPIKQENLDRVNAERAKYETKDSGKRFESPDGMVRDTSEGKPQFTLMFPKGIPFEDQLMTRVADLYHRGGVKYGPRNWEKSSTEEALAKHEDCLMRHVVKFLLGVEDGEDHAAAIVWNVNAVDLTRRKIARHAEKSERFAELYGKLPDNEMTRRIDDFLNTHGVKEVQPEYEPETYPTESEQAEIAKTVGERMAQLRPLPPTAVEFKLGD